MNNQRAAAFRMMKETIRKELGKRAIYPGTYIGAGVGSGLGGYSAYKTGEDIKKRKLKWKPEYGSKNLKVRVITGALGGGVIGGSIGKTVSSRNLINDFVKAVKMQAARKGGRVSKHSPFTVPSWLKGAKTKVEAKSAFKQQARQHHPDLGGNPESFKKINKEWEKFREHPEGFEKLSNKAALMRLASEATKQAPPSVKAAPKKTFGWFKKHLRSRKLKYHLSKPEIIGAVIGTPTGAVTGIPRGTHEKNLSKEEMSKRRIKRALIGAAVGGISGYGIGGAIRSAKRLSHYADREKFLNLKKSVRLSKMQEELERAAAKKSGKFYRPKIDVNRIMDEIDLDMMRDRFRSEYRSPFRKKKLSCIYGSFLNEASSIFSEQL